MASCCCWVLSLAVGQNSVDGRLTTAPSSGVTASRCKPQGEYFDVVNAVDAGQEDDMVDETRCNDS
jgi:hypothetical protein